MAANLSSKNQKERRALIESLMASGASLNEIRRTTGADYRTVRRIDPGYKPFPVGGGGEAQIIRQVNQDLERLDKHGNLGTRRGRT